MSAQCLQDLDGDGKIEGDYTYDFGDDEIFEYGLEDEARDYLGIFQAIVFFVDAFSTMFQMSTINELWYQSAFFNSGLVAGKSLLGMVY